MYCITKITFISIIFFLKCKKARKQSIGPIRGKRSMGYKRDHLTPVHRSFRLCEVLPVAHCMFPVPTIDSSEYTFGDTVGADGCSKSRKRDRKFHVHTNSL